MSEKHEDERAQLDATKRGETLPGEKQPDEAEAGERDLRYGEAFGTQRDRSETEEDGYLDPEFGSDEKASHEKASDEGETPDEVEGERNLRYGNAFGTQRDRSKPEEGGYLDPEFGSREPAAPNDEESENPDERGQ